MRFPLVRKSTGWGCICPDYYIGLSSATTGGGTWVEPRFTRVRLLPPGHEFYDEESTLNRVAVLRRKS